jgi:diguanylate cyclase (GGDEF)-like protein
MDRKSIVTVGIPPQISEDLRQHFNKELFYFINLPSAEELINFIKANKVDLIFVYHELPDLKNYEELCIALRSQERSETVPVIVITKLEENKEERIRMFNSGLIDGFLNSLTSPEEIAAYANVFLQRRSLEQELEFKNELLNKLSITDELTKLYNRRYLIEAVQQEINKIKRYDYILSCLMLDIDFYKNVNDKFGHASGDIALEKLAELVKKNIRVIDIPCRYGGDEIMVILPFTNFDGAYDAGERLRKKIEEYNFGSNDTPVKFTISLGLVCLDSKDEVNVDSLFRVLDKQLYKAKDSGRNKLCGGLYKDSL